jgi:hypothetical protein
MLNCGEEKKGVNPGKSTEKRQSLRRCVDVVMF